MVDIDQGPSLKVNPLALTYHEQKVKLLERLLRSKDAHPAEALWRKVFKQPNAKIKQLGRQDELEAASQLRSFLQQYIGHPISTPEAQEQFAREFQQFYTNAYGPRKNDRADRTWRLATCRNVLASLNLGFTIISANGSWILQQQGGDLHG